MNVIQVFGHLGADPKTGFTSNGQKVTNFSLATSVRRGGKDETVWYRITIWGDRFEKMMPYLKKGSALIVYGELGKPEIYTDKEGRQQISMEITAEFIRFSPFGKGDKSGDSSQDSLKGQFTQTRATGNAMPTPAYSAPDIDDGLPF